MASKHIHNMHVLLYCFSSAKERDRDTQLKGGEIREMRGTLPNDVDSVSQEAERAKKPTALSNGMRSPNL